MLKKFIINFVLKWQIESIILIKQYTRRTMKSKKSQMTKLQQFFTKPQQSYAPFGAVSPRAKNKKKGEDKKELGPGEYDIALPIVKPIIQTYKKKNNNIIVKLSHIGTSSFQGEKQRFGGQSLGSNQFVQKIGPGKYSPQKSLAFLSNSGVDKSAQLPQRKQAGVELAKLIKNRQHRAATFSQVKRISIQEYFEMPAEQGKNNKSFNEEAKNKLSKVKGAPWSLMKQQRIKEIKNPFANLGPGKYYFDELGSKKSVLKRNNSILDNNSSFKSQSVRSFFDNIRFETNLEKKALIREAIGYKSNSIGPGTYQFDVKESKENKFQFFGSTVERN